MDPTYIPDRDDMVTYCSLFYLITQTIFGKFVNKFI